MDRKQVILSPEETGRQREYEQKLRALHQGRGRTPLALVDTFGCQQNVADSQHIMGMLRAMGCEFTRDADRADIIVLNTCAIRDHAEKRVFGNLGALTHTKKKNPDQIICLCGCMAQRPEIAEKVRTSYRHVDLVFGPQAMWKFPELLYRVYTRRGRVFSVEDESGTIAEGMPVVREGHTRAWVSIMYGCNNFCSYCIVPYVRGRERSRDMDKIVAEVRELADQGFKEITLLGQNVNSYGKDLEPRHDFADLLRELDKLDGDFLLRFMSSQPKDASFKLFDTMAQSRHVAHQLHLPVQSGCTATLHRMGRPYSAEAFEDTVRMIRAILPQASLSCDVIVGFPDETDEEFEESLALCRRVGFSRMHVFRYSKRPGTLAAEMPDQVPPEVMAERSRRMRAAAQELAIADARRRVGTVERAVLEYGDNLTLGSFHHARLDDTCGLTAPCLLDVAIIGVDDSGLVHARREVHGSLED